MEYWRVENKQRTGGPQPSDLRLTNITIRRRGEEGVCLARGLGLINIIPSQIKFTLNIIIIIEYFREFSLSPPSPALGLRVNK